MTMSPTDLQGVRDTLVNRYGIANERIGWENGYVTIDGRPAIKAEQIISDRAYASPSAIASGVQPFLQQQQQAQTQSNIGQQLTDLRSQLQELFPQQQSPVDQQFSELLQTLSGRITGQQPISLMDVYASPQYTAQQAQLQRQAQQATRAAQEALGAAGLGRSTRLSDRAQRIQQEANEYLTTQVVPAIMQTMQAERDRQTAALMDLLGVLGQERQFQQQARQADLSNLLDLLGFQAQREDVAAERAYRTQRDLIEDLRYAEERAYQMARDAIADERWKMQFDEDVRRFGLQYALDQARLRNQISEAAADRALRERSLALEEQRERRLQEQARMDELYRIWEATGRAPAGIPNVAPGTPLYDPVLQRQLQQAPETSTNDIVSEVVSYLDRMTPEQRRAFFQGERANLIRDLGIDGYNRLYRMYFDEYGYPIE